MIDASVVRCHPNLNLTEQMKTEHMKIFNLLGATTATRKMQILEDFIVTWYGPRADSFGVDEVSLHELDLPMPLQRFYRFAGRWPARLPPTETGLEYFYTGAGYHHLLSTEEGNPVKLTHDGFIEFYMEHQGDWEILTKPGKKSHNVWLRGCWNGCPEELEHQLDPTTKLPMSLVDFLISHVLFTSLIEFPNNPIPDTESISNAFQEELKTAPKIWEAPNTEFPFSYGSFYQLPGFILACQFDGKIRIGTNHPWGLQRILDVLND